jgi:Regulator of chromosome condensation (RCC1) repeat
VVQGAMSPVLKLRMCILLAWFGLGHPGAHAGPEAGLLRRSVVNPQVISVDDQAVLLAPDGSLWAWGGTDSRMVAMFGKPTTTPKPTRVGSDRTWLHVAARNLQVFGIKADGSLWGWGWIASASRKRLASEQITSPQRIGTATDWSQVCAGVAHAVALQKDSSLWAWGRNDYGQVGDDTRTDRSEPVRISEARWTAITAGSFNSFGLRQDGTIWGWGSDLASSGGHDYLRPSQLDSDTHWRAISAGAYHLLGLKEDGSLWIMGQNVESALPKAQPATFLPLTRDRDWTEIHSGQGSYLARKSDATWWGYLWQPPALTRTNTPWMPTRLPFPLRPWAIAAGKTSVCLDENGTLWTWGPRLGYLYLSQVTNQVEQAVIRVKQALPNSIQLYLNADFPVDEVPHRIWQLPRAE